MARQTCFKMPLSADWNALGRADAVIPWFRPFVLIESNSTVRQKSVS